MSNQYPKWVRRAPHVGEVLCLSKAEEDKLLEEWEMEKLELAEAQLAAAKADAEAAQETAQVVLKASDSKKGK